MDYIYKNPNEPIEARVKDLLSRMTLNDKIAQMTQIERTVATPSLISHLSIGMYSKYSISDIVLKVQTFMIFLYNLCLLCRHNMQALNFLEVEINFTDPN